VAAFGFWQHRTDLLVRVPRVMCVEHGVLQVEVPSLYANNGTDGPLAGLADERVGGGPHIATSCGG